jgi:trk system potassium uptake protein TrkA
MRQIAVIGLGRFGFHVAETLTKLGHEVLAIDSDEEQVARVGEFATYAVQCDATDEKALRAVSAQNVDMAVVSIGENIEASLLVVMTLKELGVERVLAKAVTALHGKILENMGVSEVIYPERDAGIRLAHRLTAPNVLEYLQLSPGYSIEEVEVPEPLIGKPIGDSQIRAGFRVNIIAVKKKVQTMIKGVLQSRDLVNFTPAPTDVMEQGDVLVVVGREEDLEKFCLLGQKK